MGQQTDSQGAAGVVESESTWFCETHAGYGIFDVTTMFYFVTKPKSNTVKFRK